MGPGRMLEYLCPLDLIIFGEELEVFHFVIDG